VLHSTEFKPPIAAVFSPRSAVSPHWYNLPSQVSNYSPGCPASFCRRRDCASGGQLEDTLVRFLLPHLLLTRSGIFALVRLFSSTRELLLYPCFRVFYRCATSVMLIRLCKCSHRRVRTLLNPSASSTSGSIVQDVVHPPEVKANPFPAL